MVEPYNFAGKHYVVSRNFSCYNQFEVSSSGIYELFGLMCWIFWFVRAPKGKVKMCSALSTRSGTYVTIMTYRLVPRREQLPLTASDF